MKTFGKEEKRCLLLLRLLASAKCTNNVCISFIRLKDYSVLYHSLLTRYLEFFEIKLKSVFFLSRSIIIKKSHRNIIDAVLRLDQDKYS